MWMAVAWYTADSDYPQIEREKTNQVTSLKMINLSLQCLIDEIKSGSWQESSSA